MIPARPLAANSLMVSCLALVLVPVQSLAEARGKLADCRIESSGKVEFAGKCRFLPEGTAGSFSLSHADDKKPLYGGILMVNVYVVSRGVAEVRGLTRDGINSRWGEAKRVAQDPACWQGSDFKVCAR
jgi:hypothetical protein